MTIWRFAKCVKMAAGESKLFARDSHVFSPFTQERRLRYLYRTAFHNQINALETA